jgi:hypothetical protein
MVEGKKWKTFIAEDLYGIACKVQQLLIEAKKCEKQLNPEAPDFGFEYLKQYQFIRYVSVICVLNRAAEVAFRDKNPELGRHLNNTLLALARRDHVRVSQQQGTVNVFIQNLNSSLIRLDNVK